MPGYLPGTDRCSLCYKLRASCRGWQMEKVLSWECLQIGLSMTPNVRRRHKIVLRELVWDYCFADDQYYHAQRAFGDHLARHWFEWAEYASAPHRTVMREWAQA